MNQLSDYFSLKNKVAVVTGVAQDISLQIASALRAAGANLAILDEQEQGGQTIARLLETQFGKARFWSLDVSDETAVKRMIATVETHFGRIDILINSAGVNADLLPGQGLSIAQWQRTIQLNVNGSILCSKHVVDAMERAGGGAIVNVLSLCGMSGSQQTSADFAAKAALRMAYINARSYAARNIRVNCIHPGLARPPVLEATTHEEGDLPHTFMDMEQNHQPEHIGSNSDVAAGVLYLVSETGRFITGNELVIDSGATNQ
ncbi:NAD(P)-dependent dehydrogenase (short-subunit alcohol dehydrogenase family) [Collimonas sp. PA-H2]|uniref:SDR family NAD(P)-dependent oxidoreductase n=1 Tax=Collimonas sp. PA-H2 TaxID=1881062 RepID=UPI000BF6C120|nr:SDR family oxidoreductase [Collimonas sp. PA-H2]PFH09734.1 NAD(P)-dependent dehydrogenase (short-subunit alcohol dehydrogenase family) [Collimonas sp. PA-H2]